MSFHHGYLDANEYHFQDFVAHVVYKDSKQERLSAKAKLIVTSHNLFIDFESKRERKKSPLKHGSQKQALPLLKVGFVKIEDFEVTNSTKKEEMKLIVAQLDEFEQSDTSVSILDAVIT